MKNKFYTSRGFLTRYALSCGYLETSKDFKHNFVNSLPYLTLEKDCIYHVKGRPYQDNTILVWHCFDTYPAAKTHFLHVLKNNGLKRHINKS
jgi:hypothetical protein